MWKNYLLVALRNTRRQKGYAAINVFGLAVGLACAFLITLYVRHELSYDRDSANADRVYRLTSEVFLSGEHTHYARAASGVGAALQAADPSVEAVARLWSADPVVRAGGERLYHERFYYADPSTFRVFATPFLAGAPATALTAPGQVVLTETAARRYFGDADPMGRTVRVGTDEAPFEVVGVVADVPEAAHVHYDVLASMSSFLREEPAGPDAWVSEIDFLAYVLLRPGARPEAVEARAAGLVEANVGEMLRQFGATYAVHLQPLTSIHLHSALTSEAEPTGDALYVWVFASVALIVLLIAWINFTNLATARALDRAKEVGMRKALGAARGQLVRQFLAESLLLTALALVLAVGLAVVLLPVFNSLTGRNLALDGALGAFALMALAAPVVALLAGAYPAFVLSGYRPAETLRGRFRSGRSGLVLRRALVVTQFALTVVLVTGAFVVREQLAYARTQRLGFDREQVVVLPLRPDEGIRQQEGAFKAAVLGSPHAVSATLTDNYPAGANENNQVYVPGGRTGDEAVHLWEYIADADLLRTLGMDLADGRPLDPRRAADSTAFLVNESAARLMGLTSLEDARLTALSPDPADVPVVYPVVGVVRDFHVQSFRHEIRPLVVRLGGRGFQYDYLLVRVRPGQLDAALADLRQTWSVFSSGSPFSPSFLDREFDALYGREEQLAEAFGYFTVLALLVACLGLLGLSAYAAEQRRKEIGVRKVLGASVPGLVALLARDFARPVLVAVVVAAPVAYVAAERWLGAFVYRVPLGPGPFVLAGALALGVALATVSAQTFRAASADPVKALRSE